MVIYLQDVSRARACAWCAILIMSLALCALVMGILDKDVINLITSVVLMLFACALFGGSIFYVRLPKNTDMSVRASIQEQKIEKWTLKSVLQFLVTLWMWPIVVIVWLRQYYPRGFFLNVYLPVIFGRNQGNQ